MANKYYPFGMTLPNRSASSTAYRYVFQGQEKDDELKGEGNSLNYKFRMHDSRVGRFFAVDPLTHKYPWYTPYSFSGNKVVAHIELEGLENKILNDIKREFGAFLKVSTYENLFSKVKSTLRDDRAQWKQDKFVRDMKTVRDADYIFDLTQVLMQV